ncbi:hypothetical protein GmHk_19G056476 [Glycine max]|nr:hypothetical protein GmHk_19G056476 [Glycine max]
MGLLPSDLGGFFGMVNPFNNAKEGGHLKACRRHSDKSLRDSNWEVQDTNVLLLVAKFKPISANGVSHSPSPTIIHYQPKKH